MIMSSQEFVKALNKKAKTLTKVEQLKQQALKVIKKFPNHTIEFEGAEFFLDNSQWIRKDDVERLLVDFVVVPKQKLQGLNPKTYFKDFDDSHKRNHNYVDGFCDGIKWIKELLGSIPQRSKEEEEKKHE